MKKIILLTSLLLQIACGQSFQQGNGKQTEDLREYELKGNVKSLEYATYEAIDKSGEIVANEGKFCATRKFSYKGKILFDKNGNMIEITTSEPLPGREFNTKTIYIYDGKKLIKEEYEQYYTDNKSAVKRKSFIYGYDNKGYKTKKKIILPNGKIRDEIIYKYNSNGQLIRIEKNIGGEDAIFSEENYEYDARGNIIVIGYDGYKNIANVYLKYNDRNQLIELRGPIISDEYSGDPIPDVKVGENISYYEYDSKGNLIGERYTTTKREMKWIDSEYIRYESDDKGNWIKSIRFQDTDPISITLRTIEYY